MIMLPTVLYDNAQNTTCMYAGLLVIMLPVSVLSSCDTLMLQVTTLLVLPYVGELGRRCMAWGLHDICGVMSWGLFLCYCLIAKREVI